MSHTEGDLQAAIIRWASTMERQYPELKWLHHVPNGGKRDTRTAMNLQAQGVKKGILDLVLDVPRYPHHGLRIELKKPGANQKPTVEQREYIAFLNSQGYFAMYADDFDECKRVILAYLSFPPWPVVI